MNQEKEPRVYISKRVKRIAELVKLTYGVDVDPEVVVLVERARRQEYYQRRAAKEQRLVEARYVTPD